MSNVSSLPVLAHEAKATSQTQRRCADFHPTIWGDYFLAHLPTSTDGDTDMKQIQMLKENVRQKLIISPNATDFSSKLNFIDSVKRLGVSYHFEREIEEALHHIYCTSTKDNNIISHYNDDLHHLALLFRLLRQQGHRISSHVFYKFKDETGKFMKGLSDDMKGMLSLYEAAQLRVHGEEILDEANNFTHTQLTEALTTTQLSPYLDAQVRHSLGQTLRRGMPRLESGYYISFYQHDPSHDQNLLTFAKLDFNMLQQLHQKEVSNMTKWWNHDLNVSTKFPFVRDRIVEACFWIIGVYYEPKYALARRILMKVLALSSIIDDIYDAYGTIEELELFTTSIERWDISCLDVLPECIRLCYSALLETYDEIELELKRQGKASCIKYVKEEMKGLVRAYIIEARWLNKNYTPTLKEYMQVGTVSCGYAMLTITSFIGMEDATEEEFKWATSNPTIIQAASTLCRLMDDIVGSEFEQKRGHVASSVDCYMKQHNISSRKDAIEELRKVIESAWKDINEACLNPTQVPMAFLMRVVNLARMMDVLYKEQDNYTHSGGIMKDHIQALLVNKVPL